MGFGKCGYFEIQSNVDKFSVQYEISYSANKNKLIEFSTIEGATADNAWNISIWLTQLNIQKLKHQITLHEHFLRNVKVAVLKALLF